MAKKPMRGNYLMLENVRVSYDKKLDSIYLTSKDKDLPQGKGFNLTLNGGREAELTLREMLEDFGMIELSNRSLIPKILHFDTDVVDSDDPHRIPLGQVQEGQEFYWNVESNPHIMLIGGVGSGKSVTQRLLFLHCFKHPEDWSVKAIDLKRIELSEYDSDSRDITIAKSMEQAHDLSLSIIQEMNLRYSALYSETAENADETHSNQKSILFLIEEIGELIAPREHASEKFNNLQKETIAALKEIIDRGSRVGIHVTISSQRIDLVDNLDPTLVDNFMTISMGRAFPEHSFRMFENNGASRVNHRIRGRGYYRNPLTNEEGQVQIYYTTSLSVE